MATIKVPAYYDLVAIALDAGAGTNATRFYCDGWYTVDGVSDAALEAALGRYDHLANRKAAIIVGLRERAQRFIRAALDDLDLMDLVIGDMAVPKKNAIIAKVRAAKGWVTSKEAQINAAASLDDLNAIDLEPK